MSKQRICFRCRKPHTHKSRHCNTCKKVLAAFENVQARQRKWGF